MANSIFSGIHLGLIMRECSDDDEGLNIWLPLLIVRILRMIFVPLLLDGMMVIGSVIANPLGHEADDFPGGSYLEEVEDECLAMGAAVEACHPSSYVMKKPKT